MTPTQVAETFQRRAEALGRLRANPASLGPLRAFYAANPAAFISDWGVTIDPRLPERGLPAMMPFSLFPRQVELIEWIMERYARSENGAIPKSRDVGASWVTMALACTLCLFREGIHIGFGSRKEEYVDKLGAPKALFPRARLFLEHLPREFMGGWTRDDFPHMRCLFPATQSAITGEAGDNIGRGDRASIYFVDEAAFLERPMLAEASLSATTNCRIDLSSSNGTNNPFADKVLSRYPDERIFWFRWQDDPRKDQAWYDKQCADLDAVVVAQEIDINFSASIEGILIPAEWVRSAIGAADKLSLTVTGARRGAMDVADGGADKNAYAGCHGIELNFIDEWSGKGSDIAESVVRAHEFADLLMHDDYHYDADGLGAGVRGDARLENERRAAAGLRQIDARPWRGSGEVVDPDREIPTVTEDHDPDRVQRLNRDYFLNAKAQGWFALRMRFQLTHRAVTQGIMPSDPDRLISLNPHMPLLQKLVKELSQPTWKTTGAGKMQIEKAPDGAKSPNLADAVMILFAPKTPQRRSFFD